ncbi:MAG TPA: hypothetical protein DEV93_22115 [Chloroflexi bacterium]|nr:hypothetical protein [Chloroflexota bacterium]
MSQNLQSLVLIETVAPDTATQIVPIRQITGSASTDGEVMARKIQWANKAGFSVVTHDVPSNFAPFNAVIRISESGTEDRKRDYLAELTD